MKLERNVYQKLEVAVINAVSEMREKVAELDDCPSYFDFNIEVAGRTLDGDMEITFKFDGGSYSKATKGGKLEATFEEYLRRYGWSQANAPLCLPRVTEKEDV